MHLSIFGPWPSCLVLLLSHRVEVSGCPRGNRVHVHHIQMLRWVSYMGARSCIRGISQCPAAPVAGDEMSSNVWLA